jgi:nucleoside-diphosphate-sugar epimerase
MKVLVVGGAGYIGSVLSKSLWSGGHDVTVLDLMLFGDESLRHLLGEKRFRVVHGDIRDIDALRDIVPGHDALILLAAIVGEPACNRDEAAAVETNLQGTRNVLKVAKEANVSRFIFASTCSNYGVSNSDDLVTEHAPLQPLSTYSETKVTAEAEILAEANGNFFPTVLRFSTAFGVSPRMRFDLLVSDFTLAAVRDRKVVVYGEQFWRPFVHISDIASAIHRVLEADPSVVSGEVFNVGSNEANVQKEELARSVARIVPETELEFVERNHDPRSYRVDFTKIRERLGFQAAWTVEDGIQEVYQALRDRVWQNPADPRYYN